MMRSRRAQIVMMVAMLWSSDMRAAASVPAAVEDLARRSVAVVIGTVESLVGVAPGEGDVFTLVELQVDEVLKGDVRAPRITLKEDGGQVGHWRKVVFGSPTFEMGEHVLVFLDTWPDGSLRTSSLGLGKFRIEADPAGVVQARQQGGPDAPALNSPGRSLQPIPLDGLRLAF